MAANLKLAASPPPPPRDDNRAELAEAIRREADAKRLLADAEKAVVVACERRWDLRDKLDALRKAVAEAPIDPVAAVLAGSDFEFGKPARDARMRAAELEREIESWKDAEQKCEAEIPARRQALEWAEYATQAAAQRVVKNTNIASKLMDGLADLEAEIIRRRVALRYLLFKGMIGDADRAAINSHLRNNILPGGDGSLSCFTDHPAETELRNTIDALKRDAGAPLPV
jgi:cell division septum initiation protein DivIVA